MEELLGELARLIDLVRMIPDLTLLACELEVMALTSELVKISVGLYDTTDQAFIYIPLRQELGPLNCFLNKGIVFPSRLLSEG